MEYIWNKQSVSYRFYKNSCKLKRLMSDYGQVNNVGVSLNVNLKFVSN